MGCQPNYAFKPQTGLTGLSDLKCMLRQKCLQRRIAAEPEFNLQKAFLLFQSERLYFQFLSKFKNPQKNKKQNKLIHKPKGARQCDCTCNAFLLNTIYIFLFIYQARLWRVGVTTRLNGGGLDPTSDLKRMLCSIYF